MDDLVERHAETLKRIEEEFFPSRFELPIHDWVPTGHETLACQYEGCGMSLMGGDPDFYAIHKGPAADFNRNFKMPRYSGWSGEPHPGREF